MRGVRALVGGFALLVALIAPTALLAAEDEPATSAGAVTAPGGPNAASSSKQATHDVAMKDIKFVPEDITVDVGDTVTWTNEDSVDHNAIAEDESFRTPTFGEGETASVTIDEAGSYPYFCSLHANMEGRVTTTGFEAGGGGEGGGSGGENSGGSADSPTVTPDTSGDPGAAAGTGASTDAGGDGSSLPLTGSDSVWLAIAGAWLLAVGAAVRAAAAGRV